MNDMLKNMLVWIVIAVVIMSVFNNFVPQKEASTNLSYSEFINQVKDNQIESVMIEADGIRGQLLPTGTQLVDIRTSQEYNDLRNTSYNYFDWELYRPTGSNWLATCDN